MLYIYRLNFNYYERSFKNGQNEGHNEFGPHLSHSVVPRTVSTTYLSLSLTLLNYTLQDTYLIFQLRQVRFSAYPEYIGLLDDSDMVDQWISAGREAGFFTNDFLRELEFLAKESRK